MRSDLLNTSPVETIKLSQLFALKKEMGNISEMGSRYGGNQDGIDRVTLTKQQKD